MTSLLRAEQRVGRTLGIASWQTQLKASVARGWNVSSRSFVFGTIFERYLFDINRE